MTTRSPELEAPKTDQHNLEDQRPRDQGAGLYGRIAEFATRHTPMWATILALLAASYGPFVSYMQAQERAEEACRIRNGAFLALRNQSFQSADALAVFLSEVDVEEDFVDRYLASQYRAITPAEETDRDCNHNGRLDAGDYPGDRVIVERASIIAARLELTTESTLPAD